MSDYSGPVQADLNPIRYNDDLLGFSARCEVTKCGNRHEDYIEIRAFDPIPDRVFGARLEGDWIVLPLGVAIQVAAAILRTHLDEEKIGSFGELLDRILGRVTDDSCADCGTDTCPSEMGLRAEAYMVHDEVWAAAGMGPKGGHLCIGCIENRLGRRLAATDFRTDVPLNDLSIVDGRYAWSWRTPRLISRLSGQLTRTDEEITDA